MEQTEIEKLKKRINILQNYDTKKVKEAKEQGFNQGIQKSIDVLTLLHNYCVETKAMSRRSILDDFDTKITQELQKLNQYVKKK